MPRLRPIQEDHEEPDWIMSHRSFLHYQSDPETEHDSYEDTSDEEAELYPRRSNNRRFATEGQLRLLAKHLKKTLATHPEKHQDPETWSVRNNQKNKEVAEFLSCYTYEEIAMLQKKDEDLRTVKQWFEEQYTPDKRNALQLSPAVRNYWVNFNNIQQVNGILYQTRSTPLRKFCQLLVPRALIPEVIKIHHRGSAKHYGVNKTSKKIRERFHWHLMDDDIRNFIRCCDVCNPQRGAKRQPSTYSGKALELEEQPDEPQPRRETGPCIHSIRLGDEDRDNQMRCFQIHSRWRLVKTARE